MVKSREFKRGVGMTRINGNNNEPIPPTENGDNEEQVRRENRRLIEALFAQMRASLDTMQQSFQRVITALEVPEQDAALETLGAGPLPPAKLLEIAIRRFTPGFCKTESLANP